MALNQGKKWEAIFKANWQKCFPGTFIYRLPDQVSGYKTTSKNPSDFIAFTNNKLWLLECKETKLGTLNFSNISQLDTLNNYLECKDVEAFIVIWYSTFDKVLMVPAAEAIKMKNDGAKSISLKMLNSKEYNIIEVPSIKKRVFMESDFFAAVNMILEVG